MRAGEFFKFTHMAVFLTALGLGTWAMAPAIAQVVIPGGEEDEEPPVEEEEEEPPVEEEEEPPVEEEEEPPVEEEEEPPVEEEEPPVEEEEEPPVEEEEPSYEEEEYEEEYERQPDNPTGDRLVRKPLRLIKSDREAYAIPVVRRISPPATEAIEQAITNSASFCSQIQDERYLVDCNGERLLAVARAMPRTGEYAEARAILTEAAQKMRSLAAANSAPAAPRVHATGKVGTATVRTRPLTAVRKERVKQVNQQAAAILQEAETKLLRAAQSSDRRLIAYAQISKAVGSNKKLLRSA